jgi:hypothetical protein
MTDLYKRTFPTTPLMRLMMHFANLPAFVPLQTLFVMLLFVHVQLNWALSLTTMLQENR